jgi:hypothetical protein
MAALILSACAMGNNEPQTIADDAAAQIMAECQEQALAPEFDLIRSRVNLSVTGADPAPFMLLSTELPTASERIEIARWSEIRDSCFQRLMAVMDSTPFGVSQALWQPMVRIFQQDGQSQHALLMALARGELTYGQFVQDSTRITARMYAAVEPFILETGVLGQVPWPRRINMRLIKMLRPSARSLAACSRSSAISLMPARSAVGFIITMAEAGTAEAGTSVTPTIGDETGDTTSPSISTPSVAPVSDIPSLEEDTVELSHR